MQSRTLFSVVLVVLCGLIFAGLATAKGGINYRPVIEGPVERTAISEQGSLISKWCVEVYDPNGSAVRMNYRTNQGQIIRSTRKGRLRCVWHLLPTSVIDNAAPNRRYLYVIVVTATDSSGKRARMPLREPVVRVHV